MIDRRDFVKAGALVAASGLLRPSYASAQMPKRKRIAIRTLSADGVKTRLAARELESVLRQAGCERRRDKDYGKQPGGRR